jgi:hypothetical protein
MKFSFFLFCILGSEFISFSQKYDLDMELKSKSGFLAAHRPIMKHIPESYTQAFELSLVYQTKGSKSWHQALKMPKIGVSFVGTSTGNKDVLGNHFGTYAFLQFPFLKGKNNILLGKVGTGIGFNKKVFDQETNPKNVAISSHVNALINFGISFQHQFKKFYFNTGLDLTHFSNGATTMPNLGINLPYFSIGIGTNFKKSNEQISISNGIEINRNWNFLLVGIGSYKDTYPTGEKKSKIIAGIFSAQKLFKHGLGYEIGMDLIYKPSINAYKPVVYKPKEAMFQVGFYNAYLLTLDRLQIIVGMGMYIKDEYFADDRFYHRVGFRYFFKKNIFANMTLKSHWAKADYLEYGIGIRF